MGFRTLIAALGLAVLMASGAYAAETEESEAKEEVREDAQRAKQLVKAGKYADAIPVLNRVVEAQPDSADAYNYLGFSHRKLKKYDAALRYYNRALTIDPDHKGANEYLGELYLQTGDLPKAEARLAKLQAICPSGCEELDDLKQAIAKFKAR